MAGAGAENGEKQREGEREMAVDKEKLGKVAGAEKRAVEKENINGKTKPQPKAGVLDDAELDGILGGEGMTDGKI